ncbi:MAG TPA: hypothetical protein VLQ93_07605, partial [Myxococcaceae bacterium]|nr:hypothetical protein [Myxococcaceae bacterium]
SSETSTPGAVAVQRDTLSHLTPYIPPQCYTKTRGESGRVHNPCFVCHQASLRPNYLEDGDVQEVYTLPGPALRNPWTNLFVDRRQAVAAMPDEELLAYVRQSNYFAEDGSLLLPAALEKPPAAWDANGNGKWDGWVPDVRFHFDEHGFDRLPDGGYTGWRAFGYYPFPGTFWPTNGSFGDVLIRLPEPFRQDAEGKFDVATYALNLAITEALIARRDVEIPPTDEKKLGVDLDGDGKQGTARRVKYQWVLGKGTPLKWVGRAQALQQARQVHLAAGLFPEGTEFAHGVYYLDVVDGRPTPARRMKELRYMVKRGWMSYGDHELAATRELLEAEKKPDETRAVIGNGEVGVGNRAGWSLQGFIEDAQGHLRPQTREESGYCMGCHSGVGATDDSVFSFGRKLPGSEFQGGWFHWSQRDLRGLREPRRADGHYEYTFYLEQNGAGDELRANTEVLTRFFSEDGKLRPEAAEALHADISTLLLPSAERALQLDKAYRLIVREQGFLRGRDATVAPAENVHRDLSGEDVELTTGILEPVAGPRTGSVLTYPGLPPEGAAPARKASKASVGQR